MQTYVPWKPEVANFFYQLMLTQKSYQTMCSVVQLWGRIFLNADPGVYIHCRHKISFFKKNGHLGAFFIKGKERRKVKYSGYCRELPQQPHTYYENMEKCYIQDKRNHKCHYLICNPWYIETTCRDIIR